jgi:cytochrome P450
LLFFFTAEQLESLIGDLFAAGTETTATTIRWAIVYLLNNMDIQNKMRKEIDEVVGSGRHPTMSDKPNLPYCEAVILETLRLGNIIPFSLPHNVSEDIHYKGYTIPKNSVLFPSLDSVVFDEQLFPDCHVFKPERFIDSNGKLCGQEKVLTFSLGKSTILTCRNNTTVSHFRKV